ncbi:putative chlorophyllase-1 [Rhexocercosporidium sp. MPI-PUGE-AT-0058]|nr:putative chlorophyllase-1 [Rhexocercosporidium sp. MPI-PUGE-AT-0058]
MITSLLVLAVIPLAYGQSGQFQPKPGYFPATGDDTIAGGIFCIPLNDVAKYTANVPGGTGSESPKGNGAVTSGSGPYPAGMTSDSSLPKHTIYAPKTPPVNVSMPFISWGNGACMTDGSQYRNFLTEIASYGYVIAANGASSGGSSSGGQSKVQDQRDSIDWAMKGGASKYGSVDTARIASAGHSCGGLEAMSVAYHDARVKLMMLFNIAIFMDEKRYLLEELKAPVAWFVGGPKDMGYLNVSIARS